METGLAGKVAFITGAASGIGKAIVQVLAAEGAHVIVSDINNDAGEIVAREIVAQGGSARFVPCDVADEASMESAIVEVVQREGKLNVMINNAGIGLRQPAPAWQFGVEEWDRVLAVNLRGVFLGMKHTVPVMLRQGGGSIVNIASTAGLGGSPLLGPYGAAKAGVIQLTQTAALELAKQNIRVNAVCPGWTDTAILGEMQRDILVRQVPIGRIGEPSEIANLAVFLASDAASFITGSAYRVDGGIRS
jgi:NAD(P)-dependent dehydrogenase (short-subunit alcohol dehydrogenase family)